MGDKVGNFHLAQAQPTLRDKVKQPQTGSTCHQPTSLRFQMASTAAFCIGLPESSMTNTFCDLLGKLPVPKFRNFASLATRCTLQHKALVYRFFKSVLKAPDSHAEGGGFANVTWLPNMTV